MTDGQINRQEDKIKQDRETNNRSLYTDNRKKKLNVKRQTPQKKKGKVMIITSLDYWY